MAKCLVLGANGFIGSHLVDALLESKEEVRAFDRFSDNKLNFKDGDKVEVVSGNFLNRDDLRQALRGIDYVFHLVSTTTPATSDNNPLVDIETNVHMTIELLEECVSSNIKKFFFASTGGAIYGDQGTGSAISEDVSPEPISPYAIGKLTIEHYLRYFKRKHKLDTLTFRISNPYGGRHSPINRQGVIPIFLDKIANDEPITILGDGSMVRDYLYVGDVANLIARTFKMAKQDLYNLGSGKGVSINELVSIIKKVTGRQISVQNAPKPATFLQNAVLDISRFKHEFGLEPKTSLEDGIKLTWEYVLNTQHSGKSNEK